MPPTNAGTSAADALREHAVETALGKLDLAAKAALLAGADMWSLPPNPDIGLGRLVMSDGPAGVRGEQWTADDPSIAIPSPTALAASWDPELARRAGRLLAQEARRKGAHVVLAPTVNLHRSPRGGRHFEAYSEDPLLTGEIGAALVCGVQDGGVGTTPKHWTANDSETDRFTVDVAADERTLRELYLAPFEAIVRKGRPWGLMAAYNQVNGHSMSEHAELNNGVLRGEWKFDGVLVSDWTGARDTVRAALGGLDVAMPGPATVFGGHLAAAVRAGTVPEEVVDGMARRVLRLAARVGLLDGAPPVVPADRLPGPIDGRDLAREIAVLGCTLLRNDGILPLDPAPGSVALIGAAAAEARIGGGGSAQVFPASVVSPLDGLRAALPEGTELTYAMGADPRTGLAAAPFPLTARLIGRDGADLGRADLPDGSVRWLGRLPGGVAFAELGAVETTGVLQPQTTGTHRLGIRGTGLFTLEAAGRVLFDGAVEYQGTDPGGAFLNPPEAVFELGLDSLDPVEVTLRYQVPEADPVAGFDLVSFALGHGEPAATADALIEQAVAAAAAAQVAIVVVATTEEVESEGVDRPGLSLPGRQDELVARVAAANPRTIVVVNAGAPVLMPWRADVAAVLLTWFPGQEAGTALAEVLTGVAEPGGRLPTTWPAAEADCPVWEVTPTDGRLEYAEGPYIGYRAWQRRAASVIAAAGAVGSVGSDEALAPAYWFGHGLGYTDWSYESVKVQFEDVADAIATGDPYAPVARARVRVRNTGTRPGREVVQIYLAKDGGQPVGATSRLAGFAVVHAPAGALVEAVAVLPLRAFQAWGADGWALNSGLYTAQVSRSAVDHRLTVALEMPPHS